MKTFLLKNNKVLQIRQGVPNDVAAFIDFVNTCAGQSDFLTFNPGDFGKTAEECNTIEEFLANNKDLYLIGEIDGQIIANLVFRPGKRIKTAHAGEFGITIRKDYWGLGIGQFLIQQLIEWARATNIIRKIDLRVHINNQRGINLYKKMGFQQEGVLKREFCINGIFYDEIIMGLCID